MQERIADTLVLTTANGESAADFVVTRLRDDGGKVGAAYVDLTAAMYREATMSGAAGSVCVRIRRRVRRWAGALRAGLPRPASGAGGGGVAMAKKRKALCANGRRSR